MYRIARRSVMIAAVVLTVQGQVAHGHEFWIEPSMANIVPGGILAAELKVGRMLAGEAFPYLSDRFERFTVTAAGGTRPVSGTDGNLPAVSIRTQASDLHVLAHQTVPFRATYTDWDLFGQFLEEEDLPEIAAWHRARGLDASNFAERYIRYAKALVPVGKLEPDAQDQPLGMAFEIVAEDLPFSPETESFTVRLLRNGAPVAHRRVSLFHSDQSKPVERITFETDARGKVVLPLLGSGRYLISSVMIDPANAPPVVWQSHWASLTFLLD
ncbi:DUF4198 domain-containing protein [Leisingera caerulea]|uniref:DUF4198 domain-containing protein n=1 Tax=Leisingera caerulea TaxID=506591 RepID=A0A9Q9M062_LEICA|nr:DUF4198 domain-containing protein [Leisingera caerulea]UWQ55956.1 DUF4198 domain-containing protein [Leisingera caerulea]